MRCQGCEIIGHIFLLYFLFCNLITLMTEKKGYDINLIHCLLQSGHNPPNQPFFQVLTFPSFLL